jgi:nicotinamidase-related amidase
MTHFDLVPSDCALILIDMQERFLPAIPEIAADQTCGRNCRTLLAAAKLLGVPTLITEQYPKGLGSTLPHLVEAHPEAVRLAKMHFSCIDAPEVRPRIDALHRGSVVLCGIETHVCVLHTAADLLASGRNVVVAADAVASRKSEHRDQGLAALRDLGALLVPAESIAMRWQRQAGTPTFKTLSSLIK